MRPSQTIDFGIDSREKIEQYLQKLS